jgi:GNAT superfamily N-acetyltransferase
LRDSSGEPIGVLTLNECAATHARGRFGEIAELYVVPKARSLDVGGVGFGREHGWHHLEVGAPAVPRFQRTVGFYLKNGFVEVGPRLRHPL